MRQEAKKIIKNSWKREFNLWFKKLQKLRITESEKYDKTGKPINHEIGSRCWGHINYQFALAFFRLVKDVKKKDINLYNKYIEEGNEILFFWDFNTEILRSEYINDRDKDILH